MSDNPYLEDPDVQLMLSFQEGDKKAFEQLMIAYFKRVMNFIYRYVGDVQLAEDLTQEVFIKVYKTASRYQVKSKFQTWLFAIAKNTSLNELRKRKRKTVSMDAGINIEGAQLQIQLADTTEKNPWEKLMQKEKNALIRQAIASLPENQRVAVLLRRYEQFSYEEIAQTMDTTSKAVKSLLNRAKENLRIRLLGIND